MREDRPQLDPSPGPPGQRSGREQLPTGHRRCDELVERHPQRGGEPRRGRQRGVRRARFDLRERRPGDARDRAELLLGQPARQPQQAHVRAEVRPESVDVVVCHGGPYPAPNASYRGAEEGAWPVPRTTWISRR
jgi:hypothetical protein